jgi:hypothetical protein
MTGPTFPASAVMTTKDGASSWDVPPETCSVLINARRMELQARLDAIGEPVDHPAYDEAKQWLRVAEEAARPVASRRRAAWIRGWWSRMRSWWSGERIERGWCALHLAEDAIIMLEAPERIRSQIPALQETLNETLDRQDPRYAALTGKLTQLAKKGTLDEHDIQELIDIRRSVNSATDDRHRGIRVFRNAVVATSAALAAMLVVAVVWHLLETDFLSLCGATERCLDGGKRSHGIDVAEVVGVGLLAGLLAGLLNLGGLNNVSSPYALDLPRVQVILKAVAGATTAVLGILLLQSGLIVDAASTTGAAMLAYAALFGYSQEVFTRVVDRQASSLLGKPT